MDLNGLQSKVDEWIKEYGVRYFSELTNMALLTEEVGEVARIISRKFGDQSSKDTDSNKNLAEEISDVLFVLTCIANQTGVNMQKAFEENIEKKSLRDKNRHRENKKLR